LVFFTSLLIFSLGSALALAFGLYFVLSVRRYIGTLPTILIGGENGLWLAWNTAILTYLSIVPAESEPNAIAIVLIFVMPIIAGFLNFSWQYLLYRSFRKK
jgi:hypothetical protein